jgi:hypothetical protein
MNGVGRAELVSLIVSTLPARPIEPLRLEYGPEVDYDLLVEAMGEAMEAAGVSQGIRTHWDPADPASTTHLEIHVHGETAVSIQVRGLGPPPIPRSVIRAYEEAHGTSDPD